MVLDFSILRCNPIVAPIREKRLEENKRQLSFPVSSDCGSEPKVQGITL